MSIFTLEKRNEVQEKLLEVGVELIKEKGIQKMTISEVNVRAGIGKDIEWECSKEWRYGERNIVNLISAEDVEWI